jgi:hypothetical protein
MRQQWPGGRVADGFDAGDSNGLGLAQNRMFCIVTCVAAERNPAARIRRSGRTPVRSRITLSEQPPGEAALHRTMCANPGCPSGEAGLGHPVVILCGSPGWAIGRPLARQDEVLSVSFARALLCQA